MSPKLQKKPPRVVYHYNKADPDDIKTKCKDFVSSYFEHSPDEKSVEENWNFFKESLNEVMTNIPHKKVSGKPSYPYINKSVIREMSKMVKLYHKAIATKDKQHWSYLHKETK